MYHEISSSNNGHDNDNDEDEKKNDKDEEVINNNKYYNKNKINQVDIYAANLPKQLDHLNWKLN